MQPGSKLVKLLLSAATAYTVASPAVAQSNVNVGGVLDAFVGSMRNSGDAASTWRLGNSGMATSYISFTGSEDLGGGLKANFALDSFIRNDTGEYGRFNGDTLFARNANVGISGGFGAVTLGRFLGAATLPIFQFNPVGDSFYFAPIVMHMSLSTAGWTNSLAGDTGWSNQVRYTTPNFGGLSANVQYQFGEEPGNSGKRNVGANVFYYNGPWSLTAAVTNVKVNNPVDTVAGPSIVKAALGARASNQKLWLVGGAYDFKVAKVYGTYGQTSHDVPLDDKTFSLSASIPSGNGRFLAAVAQTKRTGLGFSDRKRESVSLGYDYSLSKRTTLYAFVVHDKVTTFERGNSYAAGIRHRF